MRGSVWLAVMVAAGGLLLAGCGEAVPPDLAASYASRHAVSSHLVNASDVPITYSTDDEDDLVLQPGEDVTSSGGAWLTPARWRCQWRDTKNETAKPVTVGSDTRNTWVTFGGYDQTVVSCTPPR